MKYIYTSIIVALWLIIQWLTHDSYWFNFVLNLICMIAMSGSIFHHYERSKSRHFTREEYKEAMREAIEKTNIEILNNYKNEPL